jgi:hypothetical protein
MNNDLTSLGELTARYEDNLKVILNWTCGKLVKAPKSVHATKLTNTAKNPKKLNVITQSEETGNFTVCNHNENKKC